MSHVDRAVAELAATQHGLFSVQQAVDLGMTRLMVLGRAKAGRIIRMDVDVYRIAGLPPTWSSRVLAAALAAGDGALVSHRAAAALWGLEGFNKGTPEVSIPRGRRYRRAGVRSHESTDLDRCGQRVREGIPVTDPSRTLLDLARYVGDERLARAVESARRLRLTDWSQLIATLSRHARRGRPGIRRLRRVIARGAHRSEVTDSDFELLVIALLLEHGLPEPVLHHRLRAADGTFIAEIDLAYPGLRIAIELDGSVHREGDTFERDRTRQNRIVLEGWVVLRFTWATFRDRPDEIVREVRAAIRAAQAR
ncbi:MAG: type IV toxin-antitoxin system AbiEi family antitoxin domain-containing protein [Acidimicrobiales bacterium]